MGTEEAVDCSPAAHWSVVVEPSRMGDPGVWWRLLLSGLIQGLRPANERRRYFVTTSLIGLLQA